MGISEQTVKMGQGGEMTETEAKHSQTLCMAPVNTIPVKGWVVAPTGWIRLEEQR